MLWSCEALLRFARQAVPPVLVDGAAWPAEGSFRAWSARAVALAGAEVCLGQERAPAVDLAFCVPAGIGCTRLLEHHGDGGAIDPAAAGVARFLRLWADRDSIPHGHVPQVWLEFDHGPLADGRAIPFVTFMIGEALAGADGRAALPALVSTGLSALLGHLESGRLEAILAALEALPPDGRLRHVAAMPHRSTGAVRLIVALRRSEVVAYLTRVRAAVDMDELDAALGRLHPGDGAVSLNLDVEAGVRSSFGVEFYWPRVPRDEHRWGHLFDALVAEGLCTPAQRAALAAWPSDDVEGDVLLRQLLVKVVVGEGLVTAAKAYLTVKPKLLLLGNPEHTPPPSARDP